LAIVMRRMVGFRNISSFTGTSVDVAIVRDIVEHRLEDLLRLVNLIPPAAVGLIMRARSSTLAYPS
jgi:uncharacterized protein YutE (UPF0331/DUF86 family)